MSKNSLLYTTPRLLYEKNPCYPNFAKFSNFCASTIDAQNNTTNNKKIVCIFVFSFTAVCYFLCLSIKSQTQFYYFL